MKIRLNKPALAVAFATFIAFMGIGVVDPLLPLIASHLNADPFQVEWLFTTYLGVMALSMLIAGYLSTLLGGKRTLIAGLSIVVIFATLSGFSNSIGIFAIFRGGWGLGNALFTSTALSIIVGVSAGKLNRSITLYEAALGLGIASGPLLGGTLGSLNWRFPFFGTASLMAIGVIVTFAIVKDTGKREPVRTPKHVLGALKNKSVRANALIALGYNFGFFTILAYTPLTLTGLKPIDLGYTYFAWGILVAFSSVVIVPRVAGRFGYSSILKVNLIAIAAVFLLMAFYPTYRLFLILITGFMCGMLNASFTTLAIEISPFTRSISSAAYNLLRWSGAALAPITAGLMDQSIGEGTPFLLCFALVIISLFLVYFFKNLLTKTLQY